MLVQILSRFSRQIVHPSSEFSNPIILVKTPRNRIISNQRANTSLSPLLFSGPDQSPTKESSRINFAQGHRSTFSNFPFCSPI